MIFQERTKHPENRTIKTLILADQLSSSLPPLKGADRETDFILMVEVMEEGTYVRHHKKKIAFLFWAMRHFAEELREAGWRVEYVKLDEQDNSGKFSGEAARAVQRLRPDRLIVTAPGDLPIISVICSYFGLGSRASKPRRRWTISSKQRFLDWPLPV